MRAPVINIKMKTRKKPERKVPLPEEPRRARAPPSSPPKRARISAKAKSPSPLKKENVVRAEPIQLEGSEFGPLEEPLAPANNDQPSLTTLENAHLHTINQLSSPTNIRQMNLEGGLNNQQMAEELLAHANEANKRTFCPHGRVPPTQVGTQKWQRNEHCVERSG